MQEVRSILRPKNRSMWPSPNPILHIIIYMKYCVSIKISPLLYYVFCYISYEIFFFIYISYEFFIFSSLQLTPGGIFINNCEWGHQCHFSELHRTPPPLLKSWIRHCYSIYQCSCQIIEGLDMNSYVFIPIVLASRASGCLFGHQNPSTAPLRSPKIVCEEFLIMSFFKHIIEYFHLHRISMTLSKDIKPYFDNIIHVYG